MMALLSNFPAYLHHFSFSYNLQHSQGMHRVASLLILSILSLLLAQHQTFPFMLSLASRRTSTSSRLFSTTSMSSSLEQVASRLVDSVSKDKQTYVCIAVAGGGSHAISALASTPGASSILLEGSLLYDRNSFHHYVDENAETTSAAVPYVSSEAAHLLSETALFRAMRYKPLNQLDCIGVGASSALAQNKPNRKSRGHVVASSACGKTWECFIEFLPQNRTRIQQDELMGRIILQAIEQVSADDGNNVDPVIVHDEANFKTWSSPGVTHPLDAVRIAAERVLLGETSAVVLLPCSNQDCFLAVAHTVLPNYSLVFPGSFNPPHVGHVSLANAAIRAYKQYNNNVEQGEEDPFCLFELSLINADKPSLDARTVSERVHKLLQLELLPKNWGVLLTSVPLFSEKADILRDTIAAEYGTTRQMGFVIGTDTMVRILNPKYYGDSQEAMLEAVRDMKRLGVHFVVGGRLKQDVENDATFVTGKDELAGLPTDVQDMFTLVEEKDFRVDLSSTELRKQAEEKQLTSPS